MQNRFLGIEFLGSVNVCKYGLIILIHIGKGGGVELNQREG
jgi:hypothetical protein